MGALSNPEIKELEDDLLALVAELASQLHDNADAAAPVELDQTRVGRLSRMDAMQMQQQQKAERERSQLRLLQARNALKLIE
ncbi:MAG: TraR/DksA family transcriptional regulator, partial [Gammaproteobacteria bacterium]|nr:TraR/DksA family transcriptional regulator [Gammaproteobacteria bacterium]